jgi:secondary thiamine-phosphate synthase enzyme
MEATMATPLFLVEQETARFKAASDLVHLRTEEPVQFIDLTELVAERVRRSGVEHGLVCVQSLHTTAGILVNEHEPLLLDDLRQALERLAPVGLGYAHDDLTRRAPEVGLAERRNGHAHCKALLLAPSVTLTVVAGRVQLGRWQRVFLAEMDGGQRRSVSVLVLGIRRDESDGGWA